MPHHVDTHVGNKIKSLRILRGLTQTDVANGLQISFQQVQKYELGRNRISASKLFEISQILNVAPAFFFKGLNGREDTDAPLLDEEVARAAAVLSQISNPDTKAQILRLAHVVAQAQPEAPAIAAE